jgi:hypothetical protein
MRYYSKIDYSQWSQLSDSDKLFSIVDNVQDAETLFYNDNNNNSYSDIIEAKYNIMLSLGLIMGEDMKVAIVWDEKAQNSNGGTFTSGAWRQRDLNTKLDPDNLVTVASNAVTILQSGKYWIRAICPTLSTDRHQARITKNNTLLQQGISQYDVAMSIVSAVTTLDANDILRLEHQCRVTNATYGFGVGDLSDYGVEIYSIMEIIMF